MTDLRQTLAELLSKQITDRLPDRINLALTPEELQHCISGMIRNAAHHCDAPKPDLRISLQNLLAKLLEHQRVYDELRNPAIAAGSPSVAANIPSVSAETRQ